jgi:cellulose biosynthesis protein BcsQ
VRPHFDSGLTILASVIDRALGSIALNEGVVLRDSSGRLSFFTKTVLDPEIKINVSKELSNSLGIFGQEDRILVDPTDIGHSIIFQNQKIRNIRIGSQEAPNFLQILDNQISGMDWLINYTPDLAVPSRFVFASLKGGVGRSTTLAVIAADQARKGRNVLVVDLDLEAPGVGSMLLDEDRRPMLGVLDFLVESALGSIEESDLGEFIGTSQLTSGAGLVDVLPVSGLLSLQQPQNFLPKLARAIVEDVSLDGEVIPFHKKVRTMIDRFVARGSYDLVLIDVRAGMAEIAAGPILGLGARVFLFGTAQSQTIEGYRFLFSQLDTLRRDGLAPSPGRNLQMVHAKAAMSEEVHKKFNDELWSLFVEYLYDELEPDELDGFNFDVDDPDAPHNPISIPYDSNFVDWDPIKEPESLSAAIYQATFGILISRIEDSLSFPQNSHDRI